MVWSLMTLDQQNCAVLVVEDEPLIRMVAADAFEQAGVPYVEAGDADEALLKLKRHSEIGVLFTDINMPGSMDGMALATAVHERHPEIELIVTSGRHVYSDDELPDSGTFIAKPYISDRLIEVVKAKLASLARRKASTSGG
jgi:DNA-binding NtrC family response regulator